MAVPHRAVVMLLLAVLVACADDREPVADPDPRGAGAATTGTSVGEPDVETAAWCDAAGGVRDATSALDGVEPTDPAGVEAALSELILRTEAAVEVAPDEIADDVRASLDLVQQLDRALADVDYDFLAADPSGFTTGADAAEAKARVDAFNLEACGIEPVAEDADVDAGADVPAIDRETLRDQAIAIFVEQGFTAEEAACLFDNMDLDDPGLATDETAMLALVERCELDLERLGATVGGG